MIIEMLGRKENPGVIMLNGSFTTGYGLRRIADRLSDRYYILLPTYDGHHKSGGVFTTRAGQAQKIIEYLHREDIGRIALIQGVSMGAEIGLALASMFCRTDIRVDRFLFDGGLFFAFPPGFAQSCG
ncbi:MAG: alpha/beta hydrolase [Clostridiales bacterium]|nr:alpha/beta hydrolase [Clostridiales bacterium]